MTNRILDDIVNNMNRLATDAIRPVLTAKELEFYRAEIEDSVFEIISSTALSRIILETLIGEYAIYDQILRKSYVCSNITEHDRKFFEKRMQSLKKTLLGE